MILTLFPISGSHHTSKQKATNLKFSTNRKAGKPADHRFILACVYLLFPIPTSTAAASIFFLFVKAHKSQQAFLNVSNIPRVLRQLLQQQAPFNEQIRKYPHAPPTTKTFTFQTGIWLCCSHSRSISHTR